MTRFRLKLTPWPLGDPWVWDLEVCQYIFEALPVETPSLASPIQPLHQDIARLGVKLFETAEVPLHSIVVVVPSEFRVELLTQFAQA